MLIQGTEKIRGCLVISNPKLELKRLQTIHIADADCNMPDLQTAIGCGFIRVVEAPKAKKSSVTNPKDTEELKVKCCNLLKQPLATNIFPREIPPGTDFFITPTQLKDPEIKIAIDAGYIKVYNSQNEMTLNLQELAKQPKSTNPAILDTNEEIGTPSEVVGETKKFKMKEATIFVPTEPPPAARINARDQDEPKRNLNINPDVIDTPEPAPVRAPDVTGNKSVIWNPGNNPLPFSKQVTAGYDPTQQNDDTTFVDQEQEAMRRSTHPKLKDKPVLEPADVMFVDHEQDKQRIASHPVLKNKSQDNTEVDFV